MNFLSMPNAGCWSTRADVCFGDRLMLPVLKLFRPYKISHWRFYRWCLDSINGTRCEGGHGFMLGSSLSCICFVAISSVTEAGSQLWTFFYHGKLYRAASIK